MAMAAARMTAEEGGAVMTEGRRQRCGRGNGGGGKGGGERGGEKKKWKIIICGRYEKGSPTLNITPPLYLSKNAREYNPLSAPSSFYLPDLCMTP